MTCAHHGNYLPARSGPDFFSQVAVPLVNQDLPDHRQGLADFRKQGFKHIFLLHFFNIFFGYIIHISHGEQHLEQNFQFGPQAHYTPGPGKRHPDIPISQMNTGIDGFAGFNGLNHFSAWFYIKLFGNPFLKGGQQKVGQQQKRLFLPDDLDDIHVLPSGLLADRLVAGFAEFNADRVRLFPFYNGSDKIGAFSGYVRSAENDYFTVIRLQVMDHIAVVCHVNPV